MKHVGSKQLVGLLVAALILPASTQAHVTLQPREQPADEFVRANVRVPNERDNAATNKVQVQFPDGFYFASYEPVRGWRGRITTEKLPEPVASPEGHGDEITEQVTRATFTATDAEAAIGPGQFRDFGLSLRTPKKPGTTLTFKAVQTYDNGEVVRWIGAPDSEEPAPRVELAASTEPATPAPATTSGGGGDDDDASKGLGIAALVVGGLGLLVGAVALVAGRRRSA
jgi:uncharacterized protein YcnI